MTGSLTAGDLAMHVATRGVLSFSDFEPRNCPGFQSDIAKKVGASFNQTENLLRAADLLADDHHYVVERELLRARTDEREITPAMYRVTIKPA